MQVDSNELERLNLCVPQDLEHALRCITQASYVALYLDDDDNHLVWDDGFMEDAVDMDVWQQWTRQDSANSALVDLYRENPERDSLCGLLLDLKTSRLYLGNRELVKRFVEVSFTSSRRSSAQSNVTHNQVRRSS